MEKFIEKERVAVLIDSDNISAEYVSVIFEEIENYGYASYRRIYGNWAKGTSWKEGILLEYSITPVQQFDYTTGKNSTDIAMVIDAMDILYSGKIDAFCLVTSDSDFTKLAMRLREENMYVIGMGESKAPVSLTKACNKFIYLDLISKNETEKTDAIHAAGKNPEKTEVLHSAGKIDEDTEAVIPVPKIEETIIAFINDNENKGKTTHMGEIGSKLNSKYPDFDVRNYGYTKLAVFLEDTCTRLKIIKKDNFYVVELNEQTDKKVIIDEIVSCIQKNHGEVNNLSILQKELVNKHKKFDVKNYGYSRFSSFLRSIDSIIVNGNSVKLKPKNRAKGKK